MLICHSKPMILEAMDKQKILKGMIFIQTLAKKVLLLSILFAIILLLISLMVDIGLFGYFIFYAIIWGIFPSAGILLIFWCYKIANHHKKSD